MHGVAVHLRVVVDLQGRGAGCRGKARGLHDDSVGWVPLPGVPGGHHPATQGPTTRGCTGWLGLRFSEFKPQSAVDESIPGGMKQIGELFLPGPKFGLVRVGLKLTPPILARSNSTLVALRSKVTNRVNARLSVE